jgi:hypothetical protein
MQFKFKLNFKLFLKLNSEALKTSSDRLSSNVSRRPNKPTRPPLLHSPTTSACFLFLSLAGESAPPVSHPYPPFPHLYPFSRWRVHARPHPRARPMGRPHRPAGPDAEPQHKLSCLGKPAMGKDPSTPGTTASGATSAIEVRPHRSPHPCVQSPSAAASLPSHYLDWAPTPRTRAPLLASHHLLWGFFPSSVPLPREEKRGRRRGAPLPAPC